MTLLLVDQLPLDQAPPQPDMSEAQFFAHLSDATTIGHLVLGVIVTSYIETHDNPTWLETGLQFANGIADKDGAIKRHAVRLGLGIMFPDYSANEIKKNGATDEMWKALNSYGIVDRPTLDSNIDKADFYLVLGAHIRRAKRNGNWITAKALEANFAYSVKRDTGMHYTRKEASEYGVKTNATKINQNKTVGHSLGMGVLSSPVARNPIGRAVGVGIITASTGLGKIGHDLFKRDVRKAKDAKESRDRRKHLNLTD